VKKLEKNSRLIYELTDEECRQLLQAGEGAAKNVYPKGSTGYAVALMTESEKIFQGVSYKSDTRTLTMHSEMTALAHAAIHGETDIVAITGPNCHTCKQIIYENSLRSGIDIVIVVQEKDVIKQVPISELMPYPWPEKPKEKL
jgi:cytidine deaminase